MNLLSNHAISKKTLYNQRKFQHYSSLKELPQFGNYLNLPNKKLHQAITKLRISAHKFPPLKLGFFSIGSGLKDSVLVLCWYWR